jgi:hypothetical protein
VRTKNNNLVERCFLFVFAIVWGEVRRVHVPELKVHVAATKYYLYLCGASSFVSACVCACTPAVPQAL